MQNSTEQLAQWLETCRNRPVHIVKKEQDDVDEVRLTLENAVFARSERSDPDDYVASSALRLHGDGTVTSDGGDVPLPNGVFEIPLDGHWHSQADGQSLRITTDRASYIITPQAPQSQQLVH
ncbi:hypothetical protein [Paenibacillus hamazuiensis]|uniref:hypothetical protein n=1 Tax=Paenibacillus hamazuiensis TaxID=2936508 RepID=UPI00200CE35A|nr:hypothetical protein [Paenibacillus hamazuiensis]